MIWILLIFATGMFLSAFFSGCETGFYRATRFRFAIEGLRGDPVSRGLLWLTNNPSLFVATTLIGNNLANYLTSRAVVLGTQFLIGQQLLGDLLVPLLVSPFVFVYGELLPKSVYFRAPNKLLRSSGPLFLFFGALFTPVSALLWLLARGLQQLVGESPEILQLRLARTELQKVFDEGHEMGILHSSQRTLSQGVINIANTKVGPYIGAPLRMPCVRNNSTRADVLRIARRHHTNLLLVVGDTPRDILGYLRIVDVHLAKGQWQDAIHLLCEVQHSDTHLQVLRTLQEKKEPLATVVDNQGRSLGIVDSSELLQALLGERS